MAAFWLGLTLGALHWKLFLVGIETLQGRAPAGQSKLRRLAVALSLGRFLVTGALMLLLAKCGFSVEGLMVGLLSSGLGFRVFAYQRGKKV